MSTGGRCKHNLMNRTDNKLLMPPDALVRAVEINRDTPHAFFLGAGTSLSAGIPDAETCIWQWKRDIYRSNHLWSELGLEALEDSKGADIVTERGCLGLEELDEAVAVDLATLEPGPGIGVGVRGIDATNEALREPGSGLVAGELLEGTGCDDPAEIEQDRVDHGAAA